MFHQKQIGTILLLLIVYSVQAQVKQWRTVVFATDDCHYFEGNEEPPADWKAKTFDDSAWKSGRGGVGYGDFDDQTIIPRTISVYLRYEFDIFDTLSIEQAILHADYDDGFVAYLNGEEIARALVEGNPPSFNAEATDLHEALLYQNLQPEAITYEKREIQSLLNVGKNILSFQVHNFEGIASSDLSSNFFFSLGLAENTEEYRDTPLWFSEPIQRITTMLPIIKINTDGRAIPDEPKVPASIGIISTSGMNDSEDPFGEYEGPIGIEKRGQSSLFLFPKVGYGFETKNSEGGDIDTSFLGLPAEEDWILHGPYSDKTLMRNVLAMQLANQIGGYHSRTKYVELFINDRYEGVYVLMERIKRDKNRVDIARLRDEDIEGDELTGGYVFKIDKGTPDWFSNFDIVNRFGTKIGFQFVSPNRTSIKPEQEQYIESYVDSFELALDLGTFGGKSYEEYIDMQSFIDHFIIKELAKDVDAYRISSYYYKEKDSDGGRLYAGPVWDFNIAFGNADYCEGADVQGWMYSFNCDLGNPFWWNTLRSSDVFMSELTCRWNDLRQGALHKDTIFQFIDSQVDILGPAANRNFTRWPVLNTYIWPNARVLPDFESEIIYLKSFITNRLSWMDSAIGTNCVLTNTDDPEVESVLVNVYPNPAADKITVSFNGFKGAAVSIRIVNALGQIVESRIVNNQQSNVASQSFDVSDLIPGLYSINLESNSLVSSHSFIKQ